MAINDLEERTFQFARDVRSQLKRLPKTIANIEDRKRLINSSSSIGVSFMEAKEALNKQDFLVQAKKSKVEAKECAFFLRLILETNDESLTRELVKLYTEAVEIKKILSALISKAS